MAKELKFKLPLHLLVLDAIGAMLLAVGLIEWVGNFGIVPQSIQFNHYELAMIVVGIIFMLPLVFFIINRVLGRHPREI